MPSGMAPVVPPHQAGSGQSLAPRQPLPGQSGLLGPSPVAGAFLLLSAKRSPQGQAERAVQGSCCCSAWAVPLLPSLVSGELCNPLGSSGAVLINPQPLLLVSHRQELDLAQEGASGSLCGVSLLPWVQMLCVGKCSVSHPDTFSCSSQGQDLVSS